MTIQILLLASWLFLYVSYKYLSSNFNYWKNRNVPYIEPTFFFGNLFKTMTLQETIGETVSVMYKKFNTPYIGIYILHNPLLIIKDPRLIKHVLVNDFDYFYDRYVLAHKKSDSMSASMMFFAKNPEWKFIRKKFSPVFSSGKLKKMFYLIKEMGIDMISYLNLNVDNNSVDIKEICGKFSTNVITSCAFGLNAHSFQNHNAPFRKYARMMFDNNLKNGFYQSCYFVAHTLVKLFNFPFFDREATNFLRQVFWESVSLREHTEEIRGDVIDVIREVKNDSRPNDEIIFEGDNVVAQAGQFFSAGFETVSSSLTFALYELSFNVNIQQRLRSEINEKLEQYKELNYECLQSMTYLSMVIDETLRKYPVVPSMNRVCSQDYNVPNSDLILSKGIPIFISILGVHNDPQYYPNPQVFDPDRFSDDNKKSIAPFTYMPFGEGPRNCMGARFALLTLKVGLAKIISNYEISACVDTPKTIEFSPRTVFLTSKSNIPLHLKKIPKN